LDQVSRGVRLSPTQRAAIEDLPVQSRLRVVVGPAGSGKTTVLAFLTRPDLLNAPNVATGYVGAAAFLDQSSTTDATALELAAQLHKTVRGFAEAHAAVAAQDAASDTRLDAMDRELLKPLAVHAQEDPGHVHIVLDGIDRTSATHNDGIVSLIRRLSDPSVGGLANVRVIVGARSDFDIVGLPGLAHATVLALRAPSWADARRTVPRVFDTDDDPGADLPGGWLAIRLAAGLSQTPAGLSIADLTHAYLNEIRQSVHSIDPDLIEATLAVLTAAGIGPILPFDVLRYALAELGHARQPNVIRDLLTRLGPIVQRGNAGEPTEHVGLAHAEIADTLSGS
jgi:hypothetical protein